MTTKEFLITSETLFYELFPLVKEKKRFYLEMGNLGIRITGWWDRKAKKVSIMVHRIIDGLELIGFVAIGNEKTVYLAQDFGYNVERIFENFPFDAIISLIRGLSK